MQNVFRKATLLALGGAALILSGCASTDAVQKAQSTADQAMSAAQHAQQTADQALSAAQAAQKSADDNSAKIDQMGHRGPRG